MPEPINWGVVASWAVPVIVAFIAAWGGIASHKAQKGSPEHAMITLLQAQMEADRDANKETTDAMKQDIAALKAEQNKSKKREQIRDNYIVKLRRHIEDGSPPPPPPWPEGLYDE